MTDAAYRDDRVTLYHGDCLDVLAELGDASVDSVVTDPPYGLEFMGKEWDAPWKSDGENLWATRDKSQDLSGKSSSPFLAAAVNKYRAGLPFQNWCELWATECLRVLKPGGHLLAFGGTRTWHRLACAVEDAGFEIRDNIAWLYGSGFPKSLDVSKAIDKAAGAERKALSTSQNWGASTASDGKQAYGDYAGEWTVTAPATDDAKRWAGWGTALKPAFEPIVVGRKPLSGIVAATVLAHGTGALNIDGCRVGTDELIASHQGTNGAAGLTYGKRREYVPGSSGETHNKGRWPSNVVIDDATAAEVDRQSGTLHSQNPDTRKSRSKTTGTTGFGTGLSVEYADTGGASRFFPTFRYQAKAPTDERPTADGIAHPTVKPLDLMRWLVRLVTPPGGLVLEPFAGSGTTAEACIHEHLNCIAIEREADYLPLIIARLTKPMELGFNFNEGVSA